MKFTSPVFSAVSGSIAGVTYSHNAGGMYTRARAVPTNPNTIPQQQVRSNFNAAVLAWSNALTATERAAWLTYAQNVPVTNKLGQTVHLSAQQMFIRNYCFGMQPAVAAEVAPPTDAPTVFDTGPAVWKVLDITTVGYNNIGIGGTLGATMETRFEFSSPADADGATVVYRGPAVNPGVNFWKGPYRLDRVQPFGSSDTFADWNALQTLSLSGYPPFEVDQRVPIRVRNYFADGRLSQAYEAILPVVDNSV